MNDPYNPTGQEVKNWAYGRRTVEPSEDWSLILAEMPCDQLYVELAGDPACPKSRYFLKMLYLIVGLSGRHGFTRQSRRRVKDLMKMTEKVWRIEFHLLRARTAGLLRSPRHFSYQAWCMGGLVDQDVKVAAQGIEPFLNQ